MKTDVLQKLKNLGAFTVKEAADALDKYYTSVWQFIHYSHKSFFRLVEIVRNGQQGRPIHKYEVTYDGNQTQP